MRPGPIGGAYYIWDFGTKQGDVNVLGVLSYTTPHLSKLVLIAVRPRGADPGRAGCLLIVGRVVVASGRIPRRVRKIALEPASPG